MAKIEHKTHRTDGHISAALHHANDEIAAENQEVQRIENLHNQIEDGLAHVDQAT